MNRRPRSKTRDNDRGYEPSPSPGATRQGKKKKTSRRNRLKRTNSSDSNFSHKSGNDSDRSYPTGFIEPPAWNQPAYHRSSNPHSMNHYSHSNHSKESGKSNYSHSSDERFGHSQQQQPPKRVQQQQQQEYSMQGLTSPEHSPKPTKKKGIRRLLSRKRNKLAKSDASVSSKNSARTFGAFRRNKPAGNDSDVGYQSDTRYNYPNNNNQFSPNPKKVPVSLSFGYRSSDDVDSQSVDSMYDSDRDRSFISYEAPMVDHSDSEVGNRGYNRPRRPGRRNNETRPSLNQNDHLQIDNYSSDASSWDANSFDSGDGFYSDEDTGEYSMNLSGGRQDRRHSPRSPVDYSALNKHNKDLASQNLQAIESMARKEGPNYEDEAFQIFPDHSYPNTKMTRKQLRKHMNAPSAYYHDLRMPQLKSNRDLGKLRVEIMQCFGLPTTSLVKEVSAYAVAVLGSAAFQTDIIPNVANPMWLSKMRRACLFPVENMYSQLSIGVFDLEAAYAHPDTVIGHDGHPGWKHPEERTGFGFHRASSFARNHNSNNAGSMYTQRASSVSLRASSVFENRRGSSGSGSMEFSMGGIHGNRRSSAAFGGDNRRGSAVSSFKDLFADHEEDDDVPGQLPSDNKQPVEFCTKAEEFIGHVVIDLCRLRPGSMYDVTLPLRRSNHVFTREPQGSIRVRLHLEWSSERAAVMSYLPKSLGGTVHWQKRPNTRYAVNCVDDRAARNVAHAVHGIHMPGKFDMTLLKSTIREMHWTRIHLLRYCKNREIYHLTYWVYPSISGFVFLAWMHAVYFNTVRYVPGHIVVFFLLHLMKNYAYYAMDSPLQNGFLPPSLEELYWALVSGTKKRKKPCIEPLTVEREADPNGPTAFGNDNGHTMDELYDENGNLVHVTRYPLSEIADAMKKSLAVKPYRKGFTVFKHTFQGDDAVDFLVMNGFAMTRPEAVSVGRRLEREKGLFQHISKDSLFEDSNLLYCFLDTTNTDRYLSQASHAPMGGRLLELLGFYSRKKNSQKNSGGADILESREHVEFPFATGADHPRFTVKESLVIRSAEERTRLKREDEATAMVEAADFGIVLSSRNLFANHQHPSSERLGYESESGVARLDRSNGSLDTSARMNRRGSAIGNALATGATAVASGANAMMNRRSSGSRRDSGSGANLFEVATSRRDMYGKLKEQNNATLNKVLELQRKADEYDPYQYDSDNDVKTILKKKRKKHIIVEKHLQKPMTQEIGNIGSNPKAAVDLSLAKSLEKTKKHVNAFFYHMFDDQVYKIDKSVFPTKMEKKQSKDDSKKKKKRGLFNRRMSEAEIEEEEERQKRLGMTPYEQQQDELDKTLLINQYSHWNPWINRIAVILQPLLEIAQTYIFFFRALFNLFTWQDPVLGFWLCFIGPPLAFILYVCPYRMLFCFLGIYWVGPQNYLIRIYRESKEGYEPPNFDLIVKKKKIEKNDEFRELQFFSSEAPGNQQIRFRNIDPAQVKQIVVPSNVMMYGNRFYDWPPEPKYARVYASEAPSNLLVPGFAEDINGNNMYDSDSTYVFDQAARKKEAEEREKLAKKKKKKKGVGRKITDGLKKTTQVGIEVVDTAGGAVLHGTEFVLGATAGVTVGAITGTANITKSVAKGTSKGVVSAAKGTGNLLRLRKRNKKKFSSTQYYSDDDDDEYY